MTQHGPRPVDRLHNANHTRSSTRLPRAVCSPVRERGTGPSEVHQFPDGMTGKVLPGHVLLELLNRDLPREAVIGRIEADQLGDDAFEERRPVGEDGLQDGLLPPEGHEITRVAIPIGIASLSNVRPSGSVMLMVTRSESGPLGLTLGLV